MHLSIPISTFILVPIFTVLAVHFRRDLLALCVASSIFQAASVLDIGVGGSEFGLPIWIFLAAAAIVQYMVRWAREPQTGQRDRLFPVDSKGWLAAVFFFGYTLLSGFVMPVIFAGLPVTNIRNEGDASLAFGFTNLTQITYLAINVFIFWRCARHSDEKRSERIVDFYLVACTFSALLGLYQIASKVAGLPFPSEILYSNHSYAHYDAAEVAGLYRLNSTFTEASVAALFFSGAMGITISRCFRPNTKGREYLRLLLFSICLFLTVSTTAYVALALGLVYFVLRTAGAMREPGGAAVKRLVGLVMFLLIGLFLAGKSGVLTIAFHAIDAAVLSKDQSDSFKDRQNMNQAALQLFHSTDYLGAGLGSCRASSALIQLAGNTGVLGTGAFLYCLLRVFLLSRRRQSAELIGEAGRAAILMTFALFIGVPDIVYPAFWACMGISLQRRTAMSHKPAPAQGHFAEPRLVAAPSEMEFA